MHKIHLQKIIILYMHNVNLYLSYSIYIYIINLKMCTPLNYEKNTLSISVLVIYGLCPFEGGRLVSRKKGQ